MGRVVGIGSQVRSREGCRVVGLGSRTTDTLKNGVPSMTKFKLSNFVVGHAIVIFKHAIVQLKYEIRNEMLILLFNVKLLIGLFKADIHNANMAFVFEGHSTIVMFNSELHPASQYAMRHSQCAVTLFYYSCHSSKIIPLP